MNAMLQTSKFAGPEHIDWLAVSLAYLTILGEAPSLMDTHYAPGPTEVFKPYTVRGLLSELPDLTSKHLLPTMKCQSDICEVRLYYRTEPVEPLKVATFGYFFKDGQLNLTSAVVHDVAGNSRKKKPR
jgi:hypothetical protein